MKTDPEFMLRPCACCGHHARDHVSYAFGCERCSCEGFDPGPMRRSWLGWGLIFANGEQDVEIPEGWAV